MQWKENNLKCIFYQILIFLTGAIGYPCIELWYRNGKTHWTMAIVGGLSLWGIINLNMYLKKKNIILRTFTSTVFVTIIELIAGLIINKWACLKVWDYSHLKYNVCGQICLKYSMYWMVLCFIVILIFDIYFFIKEFKNNKKILKGGNE